MRTTHNKWHSSTYVHRDSTLLSYLGIPNASLL